GRADAGGPETVKGETSFAWAPVAVPEQRVPGTASLATDSTTQQTQRRKGRATNLAGAVRAALLGLILMVGTALPSAAYDVVEVRNGGAITGTVTLDGPVPAPKGFNLLTFPDPQYCGRISDGNGWRLLHEFTVDAAGRLGDVVVMLEGVETGKPFSLSVPHVEARDCRFLPFVTVVRDGHAIEVVNMDPVMHDIQAYETSTNLG